jgi:DNA-binding GntR family transcriptional regulator
MRLNVWAYETLKEQLLDGRYEFDEPLSVELLCKELRVSKQPVMQALRTLATDGLVTIIPQVGCRVALYSIEEFKDFLRVLAATEGATAEMAAARRSNAQLSELETEMRAIERITFGQGTPEEMKEEIRNFRLLNRQFHETIHQMAGASMVDQVSRKMWDLRDFVQFQTVPAEANALYERTESDHEDLFRAITEQDALRARAVAERHCLSVLEFLAADDSGKNLRHR